MWVFTGIPSAFYLAGTVIMFLGYKITDEDAAMYAKANAEEWLNLHNKHKVVRQQLKLLPS